MAINYSLDIRCQQILQMIMNTQEYVKIMEIAKANKVSRRSIYYDISKINEWLKTYGIEEVEIERSKGIAITSTHAIQIKKALQEAGEDIAYLFTPTQRVQIIICSIIKKSKPLYIEDFMSLCDVSRNTIISDLKMVTTTLEKYRLSLHYENKSGYRIVGDFITKVSLFFLYFNTLGEYYRKGIIPLENRQKIYKIDEKLNIIEEALDTKYVSGVLFALATFFASITARSQTPYFSEADRKDIKKTKEYQLVVKYFGTLKEEYQLYMALHLLGSRLQTVPLHLMVDNQDETYELAKELVIAFSNIACIDFTNQEAVITALFAHLRTSLYRYKYGIQLANPMLKEIKQEYHDIFQLTKRACQVLETKLGVPIPDSEVAYITLHFGGFIVESQDVKKELRILIICPNGVSTGNMLKAEIHALIPHATAVDTIMLSEFDPHHEYDVVISTVEVESSIGAVVVHPILTDTDRVTILRRCMKTVRDNEININGVVSIAKKYMDVVQVEQFKKELESYFGSFSIVQESPKNNFGVGMLNYLSEDTIMICDTDYNWQEAIVFASVPLLDNCSIEERYVDNIVTKCHEMGPYMFIAENVLLAHAGINDGVNRLGFSFAKFNQPIWFNEERKADIIMVLAATDQVRHIRILNDIMTIFSNSNNIERLVQTQDKKAIIDTITDILITNKK